MATRRTPCRGMLPLLAFVAFLLVSVPGARAALGKITLRPTTHDLELPPTSSHLSQFSSDTVASPDDWTNTDFTRTLELGGSVTHVTHAYVVQPGLPLLIRHPDNASEPFYNYVVSLAKEEAAALSFADVTLKLGRGKTPSTRAVLPLIPLADQAISPLASASSRLFTVRVPARLVPGHRIAVENLEKNAGPKETNVAGQVIPEEAADSLTISLSLTLNHLTEPLPKEVAQKGDQLLVWNGDVSVRSPYKTKSGKVKIKTSHPRILSYDVQDDSKSIPSGLAGKKAGATITYGPFNDVPPLFFGLGVPANVIDSVPVKHEYTVPRARIHFQHDIPVISVVELERHVEVSHWGDNLATEDAIWLRNDGPALKGHFSRIEHQQAAFYKQSNTHILTNMLVHLPPGSKDAYFIDQIGNVSTSAFQYAPNAPSSIGTPTHLLPVSKVSALELRPRYPLLGGWNYTFTVGWNADLGAGGWGKKIGNGRYSVAVPFLTPITDVAVDSAKLRLVLPEGATDIAVQTPFPMDSITPETYTTYLDTRGRTSLLFERSRCSEWCGRVIYVQYSLSPSAHLSKPFSVFSIVLVLLLTAGAVRRFDASIEPKQ